tara:strand:+ start:108 stop:590 length:483 start_codon:yes stop_codon:yes gene_type:complete
MVVNSNYIVYYSGVHAHACIKSIHTLKLLKGISLLDELMMFVHDFIAHPLMAVLRLLGMHNASHTVHDIILIRGRNDLLRSITPEATEIGELYACLYDETRGHASVGRNEVYCPSFGARSNWVVSFRNENGDWGQVIHASLEQALVEAIIDLRKGDTHDE